VRDSGCSSAECSGVELSNPAAVKPLILHNICSKMLLVNGVGFRFFLWFRDCSTCKAAHSDVVSDQLRSFHCVFSHKTRILLYTVTKIPVSEAEVSSQGSSSCFLVTYVEVCELHDCRKVCNGGCDVEDYVT
jgi:hypothetical protein